MENQETPETLNDEQSAKLAVAKNEIEALLQKHNIVLVPVVVHFGEKTITRIDIAPAPAPQQS
jgi:hypothetical protein